MEQFKIDVSGCTDDEKRQIQERLFEIGYRRGLDGVAPKDREHYWFTVENGVIVGTLDEQEFIEDNSPERPASDFLPRFQTRPHDYTGCHPDIAAALKRGEEIYCRTWDSHKDRSSTDWVFAYGDCNMYRGLHYGWLNAEPIPAEPAKKSVTLELTDEQLAKIKETIDE